MCVCGSQIGKPFSETKKQQTNKKVLNQSNGHTKRWVNQVRLLTLKWFSVYQRMWFTSIDDALIELLRSWSLYKLSEAILFFLLLKDTSIAEWSGLLIESVVAMPLLIELLIYRVKIVHFWNCLDFQRKNLNINNVSFVCCDHTLFPECTPIGTTSNSVYITVRINYTWL